MLSVAAGPGLYVELNGRKVTSGSIDVAGGGDIRIASHFLRFLPTPADSSEIGIDISGQSSKTLEPFIGESFSWLITVCDDAREACPTLAGVRRQLHWSIDDPSRVEGDEAARLSAFRAARDALATRIRHFLRTQAGDSGPG